MRLIGVLLVAGCVVTPTRCEAAVIRVPEDSPSVLAAVDLAASGDTVVVGSGTWTDTATRTVVAPNGTFVVKACAFPRGGVLLRGQGIGVTTLDVGGSTGPLAAVVAFMAASGDGPLRIESMTLTGARGPQGGQAAVGTFADGLEIRSCRFEGNEQYFGGAAVAVLWCPLTMEDCDVVDNTSEIGVVRVDLTPVRLVGCRFEGNVGRCVTTIYDPGDGPAIFQDCEFVRNRGPGFGTALNLQYASNYLIEGCLFLQNVADVDQEGAAVRAAASSGEIRNSVFAFDSVYAPSSLGAGVVLEGGTATVRNNTFVGCYGTGNGVAFAAWLGADGTFERNVVAYSAGGSAVRFVAGTSITTGCNLFWQNPFGHYTSGGLVPTDVIADPRFCDLPGFDFSVRDESPCLSPPTPSCAPIGALGAGCGGVAIEATSFGRIKSMFR